MILPILSFILAAGIAGTTSTNASMTENVAVSGPCMNAETPDLRSLLSDLRGAFDWQGTRREAMRKLAGVESLTSVEEIQPVVADSLCERALGIVRRSLGEKAISDSIALVQIGERYVAKYTYMNTLVGRKETSKFYFDERFENIHHMTW